MTSHAVGHERLDFLAVARGRAARPAAPSCVAGSGRRCRHRADRRGRRRRASASARFAAVVDLPTPPLPDATAMTLRMPGSGCSVPWTPCCLDAASGRSTSTRPDPRLLSQALREVGLQSWDRSHPPGSPARPRPARSRLPSERTSQLWRPPAASRGRVRHNSRPRDGLASDRPTSGPRHGGTVRWRPTNCSAKPGRRRRCGLYAWHNRLKLTGLARRH